MKPPKRIAAKWLGRQLFFALVFVLLPWTIDAAEIPVLRLEVRPCTTMTRAVMPPEVASALLKAHENLLAAKKLEYVMVVETDTCFVVLHDEETALWRDTLRLRLVYDTLCLLERKP